MTNFKGMPRGRLAQKELKTFNPSVFDAYQKAAWMDNLHDPVGVARSEGVPLGKSCSTGNCSGPHPRPLLMPCHGINRQADPKAGDQCKPHPRLMRKFVPAFGCGQQQALQMLCSGKVGGVEDQWDQGEWGHGILVARGCFCMGGRGFIGDARPGQRGGGLHNH